MVKPIMPKHIPDSSGVYLFKNKLGEVIYIGKAKSLKNRVRSYFKENQLDWKINTLMQEYGSLEFIETENESEALLLEAQLVQQHKPKFNVLLREGQPFLYILFTSPKTVLPTVKLVRNKKQKGRYVGPFLEKAPARKVYKYLTETFRLNTCNKKIENGCLDYHLNNCAGTCRSDFDKQGYLMRLELAYNALKNNRREFLKTIKEQVAQYSANLAFEKAQHLHEYAQNIERIFEVLKTRFHEKKFSTDIFIATMPTQITDPDQLAHDLQQFVCADKPIRTIDCFDISHFQSNYIVGSCVRFTNGKPEKNYFRRFRIKTLTQQDDYAALQEIVQRRYRDPLEIPDLILIDGGKGQRNMVKQVLPQALIISLAKKEERIFSDNQPQGVVLDQHRNVGKTLIALRDYAHHFAISYHRKRRAQGY